jgi:DNA-binding MarR family transcriptional regulator
LLKRLQGIGLVTRTRSNEDERQVFVHLTRAGVALKRRARRVPSSLLTESPLPVGDLIKLRTALKLLSAALPPVGIKGHSHGKTTTQKTPRERRAKH